MIKTTPKTYERIYTQYNVWNSLADKLHRNTFTDLLNIIIIKNKSKSRWLWYHTI